MMPGDLDGFSVLCELRKCTETAAIPVIIMSEVNAITGLGFTPETLEQHLGHAPADFLEKPVPAEQLRKAVAGVLGDPQAS